MIEAGGERVSSEQRIEGPVQEVEKLDPMVEMKRLIDTAHAYTYITKALNASPNADPSEIKAQLVAADLLTEPELAQSYLETLRNTAAVVKNAREVVEKMAVSVNSTPERVLYNLIISREAKKHRAGRRIEPGLKPLIREPTGKIELSDEFPFALTLRIEKREDFEAFDGVALAGGFYNMTPKVTLDSTLPRPKDKRYITKPRPTYARAFFPIIVVDGLTPYTERVWGKRDSDEVIWTRYVADHERGHAKNAAFMNALGSDRDSENPRLILKWGEIKKRVDLTVAVKRMKKLWGEDKERAIESKHCHDLLNYAVFRVKDELLAEIDSRAGLGFHNAFINSRTTDNFFAPEYLDPNGQYNYLAKLLKLPPDDPLVKRMFSEYEDVLVKNRDAAVKVLRAYKRSLLDDRKENFRWILAQIPVQQWSEKLMSLGFIEESEGMMLIANADKFVRDEDSEEYFQAVMDFQTKYGKLMKANQQGVLLPMIRESLKELEGLAKIR